jgi:glycosyltransferase involved in cell wall biosynthesis
MEYAITHDPAIQVEAVASARLEREVWSKCDIIYYPSEDEQKFVQAEAPSKIVRAIPPFIYDRNRLHSSRERLTSGRITSGRQVMFIGGFRHRPNVDAILWFMRDIWPSVVSKVPDARICIAGSFPPPEIQALANANVTVPGAISDSELAELYSSSRVAIIPLRFGAGIKGKVFEAISYGTSVVTTPVGIQGMQGAENLVSVCNSPDEFCAAVVEILNNPTAYLDRALAAVSYVEQTATSEVARKVFELDIPQIGALGPSHDLV